MKKLLLLAAAAWAINEVFFKKSAAAAPDRLRMDPLYIEGRAESGQQVIGGRRLA